MNESLDESLKADHTNDSYWAVLFCGTDHILYTVVLIFQSVDNNLFPVYSKYGFITVFVMAK